MTEAISQLSQGIVSLSLIVTGLARKYQVALFLTILLIVILIMTI